MKDELIKSPVTKSDIGTQTDTHLMESNLVKSYEWNEWELRRKAIKLVCCYVYADEHISLFLSAARLTYGRGSHTQCRLS